MSIVRRTRGGEVSDKIKASYYQFQGENGYCVFIKFESEDLERSFKNILSEVGFEKVEEQRLTQISVNKLTTKVLTVRSATPKVVKEINIGAPGLELMGPESISARGSYNIYKYKGVGMMIFSSNNTLWELGVTNPVKNKRELRVVIIRYLSWALAGQGIIGLWSVPVEEGLVVMRPVDANHEVVFIDLNRMAMVTQDGVVGISGELKLIRLDENLHHHSRPMVKDQLLSFLSTHTTYLSYSGLDGRLKETIYQLVNLFDGMVLPVENFKPRVTQSV